MLKTEFRHSYLHGTSERFSSKGADLGHYDLLILVSSWDKRSISSIEAVSLKTKHSILVLFDERDNSGLRDEHDRRLTEHCKGMSGDNLLIVQGSSLELESITKQILARIEGIIRETGRPLRIFIDISTCPRYYFGAITAIGIRLGWVTGITFFYAEGIYPEGTSQEIAFTEGKWKTVPIPGLLGNYDPAKNRFYLVSVGFEGWETLRVISKADPDRVSVLFPDPGFDESYPDRTYNDNQGLFEQYQIPPEQIANAHAGDAIAAWQAITSPGLERQDRENVFYLCSGTKPHSLALMLRALVLRSPAVLYNLPDRHAIVPVIPNGRYWKYEIQDVTALPQT